MISIDELDRELKIINSINKIPANSSHPEQSRDEFTSTQKQDKRLSFRVTGGSHQLISDMAKRRNISIASLSKDLMALGLQKNFRNEYKLAVTNGIMGKLNDLIYQANALGINVNQIARQNNSFSRDISLLDLSEETVTKHNQINDDIASLSSSIEDLSKEVNALCQRLKK